MDPCNGYGDGDSTTDEAQSSCDSAKRGAKRKRSLCQEDDENACISLGMVDEQARRMCSMWERGVHCDVTLKAGQCTLAAHSVVLMAWSDWFATFFEDRFGDTGGNDVELTEVEADALRAVVTVCDMPFMCHAFVRVVQCRWSEPSEPSVLGLLCGTAVTTLRCCLNQRRRTQNIPPNSVGIVSRCIMESLERKGF